MVPPILLDYQPPKKAHPCRFFSTKHSCNAATCSFHQNVVSVDLLTVAQRSGCSKCAALSAPKKGITVLDFSEPSSFVMPRPVTFTKIYFGPFAHSGSEISSLHVCSTICPPSHRHTDTETAREVEDDIYK